MDGLSGSLTVGLWGGLANGRQWQEIRGWELREDRIFVPFHLASSLVVACLPISLQRPLPNMSLGRPTTPSAPLGGPSTFILYQHPSLSLLQP